MPLLPCHVHGNYENERQYIILIRRLGTTFILLPCIVFLIGYAFARLMGCEFELSLLPSVIPLVGFPARLFQLDSQYQWENIRPGEHCLRHATREYTSRLTQVHGPHDPMEIMKACRETSVIIHGRQLKSDWCQDLGFGRGVYGFWIVDFEEPDCETRWGKFNDLGCYDLSEAHSNTTDDQVLEVEKVSVRRMESRLENLQAGSSWQIMCVTTPAEIYGRYFGTPAACFNDIKQGVYGEWDVEDTSCG